MANNVKYLALLFILVCFPNMSFAACEVGDPFPYKAPYEISDCQADIQDWLDRANSCAHFMGEPPYDEDRAEFLKDTIQELKCADLRCDYDALFTKYEGDAVYTHILNQYADIAFSGVDGLPMCERGDGQ